MVPSRPKLAQDGARMAQDGHFLARNGFLKNVEKPLVFIGFLRSWPHQGGLDGTKLAPGRPQVGSRWSKMGQGDPKVVPRWVQGRPWEIHDY